MRNELQNSETVGAVHVFPRFAPRGAILRFGALVLVASVFLVHFSATVLYLTPLNPIKVRLLSLVTGYIDPYFTQNWSMFAPEPILDDDRVILVSCRVETPGETQGETVAGVRTTDEAPVDVTSRLREMQWKYRLSPALRLIRQQMSPIGLLSPPPDVLTDHLAKLSEEKDPDLAAAGEEVKKLEHENAELGVRLLVRLASAECDRLAEGKKTVAVRPLLVTAAAPPFSRRTSDEVGTPKKIDFGWFPSERVEPM